MSETYDNKAINGKELAEQTLKGAAAEIKREGCVSAAAFNDVMARLVALEKAMAEHNLGERTADSLDAQSLKVGGTDVKTKQAAKSNPSASSGSANTFVDSLTQNENGEMTATRRVMKMYSGTGTNTDAPMTQKAASDALILKKDKQAASTYTGSVTKTIASLSQNANGEMSATFEDIDFDSKVMTVYPEALGFMTADEREAFNAKMQDVAFNGGIIVLWIGNSPRVLNAYDVNEYHFTWVDIDAGFEISETVLTYDSGTKTFDVNGNSITVGIDTSSGDTTKFLNKKGEFVVPNNIVIIDNTYSVSSVLDLISAGRTPVYNQGGTRLLQLYKYQASGQRSVTFAGVELGQTASVSPIQYADAIWVRQGKVDRDGWTDDVQSVLADSNRVTSITSSNNDALHIPSTKAVTDYIGQAIAGVGGKLISNNGQPFSDSTNLPSSTPYGSVNIYSNDYAYVQASNTISRYSASVSGSSVAWTEEYSIDSSAFTAIPITFTEASSVANIASGETLPTMLGKIAKWFTSKISTLGNLAFLNQVGDAQITGTISDGHIASKDRWNGKQDALPYADGKYGIDISGTASYATAAASGSTLAQAIAPDADMVLLTSSSTFNTALSAYNAGKKLYYVASGGTSVEYRVPLTYIMFQNSTPKAFVFQYVQDDHVDANQVGVVVVNKLTSTGWAAQSSLSVGYATSAGTANSAASASTPTPGSALAQAIDCILNPSNAASTEFSKAVTAYTAGQKMYCILGGSYEDDGNTYTFEKKVPLSYIVFAAGHVVAFCFKDVMDGHVEGSSNSGVIQTTVLRSNAWDQNVVNPYHAETASLAGNSYKWNGYDLAVGTLGGAGYISYL